MSDDAQAKLSCRNLWKVYGDDPQSFFQGGRGGEAEWEQIRAEIKESGHIPAVGGVSFDVKQGEIFVIMGLSGSGKSTLVRCLSRLIEPTSGEVLFDGENLLEASDKELIEIRRHKMGMVFQHFNLFPHLSVLENVAFPLQMQGVPEAKRLERAREMIELVGLQGREEAFPRQLSGGQQQRVGIARSLAVEPEIWFLDEPFSALDPLIRRQMQDEFINLQKVLNKTIVFITHDFLEALKLADRVAIMKDGAVVQLGTPAELVMHPADDYVAEFTDDVPLTRVLLARDIMEPLPEGESYPDREVQLESTLEEVLRAMGEDGYLVTVKKDGESVGVVTARGVVGALTRATDDEAAA